MKIKLLKRIAAMLLCVSLCAGAVVPLTGTAYAADTEPPGSGISIQISLPSNWADTSAAVKFCITDETGAGFASTQVKTELDGNWQDMTNKLEQWDNRHYGQVSISDNGTVYVKVTGHDEKAYEESRYIECFDRTAPIVRARISDQLLRIETRDRRADYNTDKNICDPDHHDFPGSIHVSRHNASHGQKHGYRANEQAADPRRAGRGSG